MLCATSQIPSLTFMLLMFEKNQAQTAKLCILLTMLFGSNLNGLAQLKS